MQKDRRRSPARRWGQLLVCGLLTAILTCGIAARAEAECDAVRAMVDTGKLEIAEKLTPLRSCAYYIAQKYWERGDPVAQERARELVLEASRYIDPLISPTLAGDVLALVVESIAVPPADLPRMIRELRRAAPTRFSDLEDQYKDRVKRTLASCRSVLDEARSCNLEENPWAYLPDAAGNTAIGFARELSTQVDKVSEFFDMDEIVATQERARTAIADIGVLKDLLKNPTADTSRRLDGAVRRLNQTIDYWQTIALTEAEKDDAPRHWCRAADIAGALGADPEDAKLECAALTSVAAVKDVLGRMDGSARTLPDDTQIDSWLEEDPNIGAFQNVVAALRLAKSYRPCLPNNMTLIQSADACLNFLEDLKRDGGDPQVDTWLAPLKTTAEERHRETASRGALAIHDRNPILRRTDLDDFKSLVDRHAAVVDSAIFDAIQERYQRFERIRANPDAATQNEMREVGLDLLYADGLLATTYCEILNDQWTITGFDNAQGRETADRQYQAIRTDLLDKEHDFFNACVSDNGSFERRFLEYLHSSVGALSKDVIAPIVTKPKQGNAWKSAARVIDRSIEKSSEGAPTVLMADRESYGTLPPVGVLTATVASEIERYRHEIEEAERAIDKALKWVPYERSGLYTPVRRWRNDEHLAKLVALNEAYKTFAGTWPKVQKPRPLQRPRDKTLSQDVPPAGGTGDSTTGQGVAKVTDPLSEYPATELAPLCIEFAEGTNRKREILNTCIGLIAAESRIDGKLAGYLDDVEVHRGDLVTIDQEYADLLSSWNSFNVEKTGRVERKTQIVAAIEIKIGLARELIEYKTDIWNSNKGLPDFLPVLLKAQNQIILIDPIANVFFAHIPHLDATTHYPTIDLMTDDMRSLFSDIQSLSKSIDLSDTKKSGDALDFWIKFSEAKNIEIELLSNFIARLARVYWFSLLTAPDTSKQTGRVQKYPLAKRRWEDVQNHLTGKNFEGRFKILNISGSYDLLYKLLYMTVEQQSSADADNDNFNQSETLGGGG